MADVFTLSGSYTVQPAVGSPSGDFGVVTSLDEAVALLHKHAIAIELTVDSPVVVNMSGVANAHVLVAKVIGPEVVATITTAQGATKTIPMDSFLALLSLTSPVTALSLTRSPGVDTTVVLFLGEKA